MSKKIKLSCKCGTAFEIECDNLINRSGKIVCPNCQNEVSEELQNAISSLSEQIIKIDELTTPTLNDYCISAPPDFDIDIIDTEIV